MKFDHKKVAFIMIGFLSIPSWASLPKSESKKEKSISLSSQKEWLYVKFFNLAKSEPEKFIKIGEKIFNQKRIQSAKSNPQYSMDYQHRMAYLQVLDNFLLAKQSRSHYRRALKILHSALLKDPSLLVRDSAVDAIGSMLQQRDDLRLSFKPLLEKAFLSKLNAPEGESYFINENILMMMKKNKLEPTRELRVAAVQDKNKIVSQMIKNWKH